MVPLVTLVAVTTAAGVAGFFLVGTGPRPTRRSAPPSRSDSTSGGVGASAASSVRGWIPRRPPGSRSPLLLGIVVAGALVGVFVWMIRRDIGFVNVDLAVERWAEAHATTFSDAVLEAVTHLGTPRPSSRWAWRSQPTACGGGGGWPCRSSSWPWCSARC